MIDFSSIRQFICAAQSGTLSAAAEKLYLSQPALTRAMQRLEQELGVSLFDRQKSKITLNENGKLFLELSEKLAYDLEASVERLRTFDRSRRTIAVGSCAPAPLWEIMPALSAVFPDKTISSYTKTEDALFTDLSEGSAKIIVTHTHPQKPDVYSFRLGEEHLLLNVPATHPLAQKTEGVTFREVESYSFLLYSQIGDWEECVRKAMPNTHFIVQESWDNYRTLARISSLPSFSSDLANKYYGPTDDCVLIPMLGDEASMPFYCHILERNRKELKPFWEKYLR